MLGGKLYKERAMRAIIAALLLVVTTTGSGAQVVGLGGRSCAEFAKDYLESSDIAEPLYFTYAQGYMSALNMLFVTLKRPGYNLVVWPSDRQKAHIRKFCSQNPDAEYVFAVQNLLEALPRTSRNSN